MHWSAPVVLGTEVSFELKGGRLRAVVTRRTAGGWAFWVELERLSGGWRLELVAEGG